MTRLAYEQVDVFSRQPFHGNGLAVVMEPGALTGELMLAITRELRQFETVFVSDTDLEGRSARLRIFTEDEELEFAGHPVLGAAAVLHGMLSGPQPTESWSLHLGERTVEVRTASGESWTDAEMDQGVPRFGATVEGARAATLMSALGLTPDQLHPDLPMQVVSTGLDYLIVPLASGLERCRISHPAFEVLLQEVGAKFVYALDPDRPEGRTWDNAGRVEDVATGSAAGPAVGYLARHGVRRRDEPVLLHQGQYAGRPSTIQVRPAADGRLWVGGAVAPVATGLLRALASPAPGASGSAPPQT